MNVPVFGEVGEKFYASAAVAPCAQRRTTAVRSPYGGRPRFRRGGAGQRSCRCVQGIEVQHAPRPRGLGHWQAGTEADDRDSCWLPVMQRQAGPGYGWQLLPRIGQEVLVDFIGGNLRQPLVLGSLYNGQGEAPQDAQATDHRPAGQGNLTGGHSPAWHGTGAAEHHHAGALSGFKDAEFGGSGHNRLVFDDSPGQLRTQLATTQSASELTLGHLIHQADNYRGSYRGSGFELRTQAYSAIRGGRGVLITTWRKSHGHPQTDPAGEASGVIALLRHATTLAQAFHQVSTHHQGVGLSAHAGSHKAQASSLDPQAAPLAAFYGAVRGMVAPLDWQQAVADAQNKNQQVSADKVPHFTDPVVTLAGKSGLAEIAGQQRISTAGESIISAAGQHLNVAIQGHWQLRSGQALSWVAGVTQAGAGNVGLELLASQGEVKVQAQAGTLTLASQQSLRLASQDGPVRLVAAKAIHIKTQAGARISIEGGNIEIHAPGTLTIHKSSLNKQGPESLSVAMNQWPKTDFDEEFILRWPYDDSPIVNRKFVITRPDGSQVRGNTDINGRTGLQKTVFLEKFQLKLLPE